MNNSNYTARPTSTSSFDLQKKQEKIHQLLKFKEKWDLYKRDGFRIANTLCNHIILHSLSIGTPPISSEIYMRGYKAEFDRNIIECKYQLHAVLSDMEKYLEGLERMLKELKRCQDIESGCFDLECIYKTTASIYSRYKSELLTKRKIEKCLIPGLERDHAIVLLSTWQQEPSIPHNIWEATSQLQNCSLF